MSRSLLACLLLSLSTASASADGGSWSALGFAQLTAEHLGDTDGIEFGADRVRAGARWQHADLSGVLVLDFNVPNAGQSTPGTLNNQIKDVFLDWRISPHWSVRGGQFKTPVGMDFNTSGAGLDITKRGLEKPLVLERDLGLMLSARKLGGAVGLDLGVFNPAGRSGATDHTPAQRGEDNALAARLLLDTGNWHGQLSAGVSPHAGGIGTQDYEVLNAGLRWQGAALTVKAEWIDGQNINGIAGNEEQVSYLHLGWKMLPRFEWVARHYQGDHQSTGIRDSSLGNTYLGFNYWPQAGVAADLRLQLNWVAATGDTDRFSGLSGYRSDALLLQTQLSFRQKRG